MRYRPVFWALLSLAVLLTLGAAPASAGLDSWHFGGSFSVGGVHFRVGYAEAGPFGSSFYFEAGSPFYYPGHRCSSYCYRRGPVYYHHPSCPLVQYHLGLYGYAPGYFIEHYGPPLPYPPPPVYYYAPPQWHVHYYGQYGRYDHRYRDPYYRDRHGRYKYDHRYKGDHGKRDHHDRGRFDDDRRGRDDRRGHDSRRDRDRHNRGRFDRD